MAWYPDAVRKPLTVPNRARNKVAMPCPVRINHHTAVSNSFSLAWAGGAGDGPGSKGYRAGYFNTPGAGGVFSHFYIRRDGVVEQMQDTAYRAACDLDGSADTISIETWDGYKSGYPGYWRTDTDVPPWNPAQVEALVKLDRWILATHPTIPRKLASDNRRAGTSSHGLSWHRLGVIGAPGYIPAEAGGMTYSTSRGKVCPGARRTTQIPDILRLITTPTPIPVPEEDDIMAMTPTERAALVADIAEAARAKIFEQRMAGPGIDAATRPTLHDYLVQTLPARTAAAVHGQWLGSSGPTIGTAVQGTYGLVRELAGRAGIDLDETALAQELAALVAPVVRDAVVAAAQAGGTPEAVADAVVAKLGAALQD